MNSSRVHIVLSLATGNSYQYHHIFRTKIEKQKYLIYWILVVIVTKMVFELEFRRKRSIIEQKKTVQLESQLVLELD